MSVYVDDLDANAGLTRVGYLAVELKGLYDIIFIPSAHLTSGYAVDEKWHNRQWLWHHGGSKWHYSTTILEQQELST